MNPATDPAAAPTTDAVGADAPAAATLAALERPADPPAPPTAEAFTLTRENEVASALLAPGHGLAELRLVFLPAGGVVAEVRSSKGGVQRQVFAATLAPTEFLAQLGDFRRACDDLKESP